MEPVSIIVSAVTAGATAALKDTTAQVIKDSYAGLKQLIQQRYRGTSVDLVEQDPSSKARELVLKEDLEKTGAEQDDELLRRALAVLDAIERQPPEQATAIGVDLERVRAANIRAKEIIAAGSGFRGRDLDVQGDIDIGVVTAGISEKN